jgi:hypothetical protein
MSLVKGINLTELQKTDGKNNLFGTFTMDLQDKKVNGNLTFENSNYFDKLFGSNVDVPILSQVITTEPSIVAKSVPVIAPETKTEEITTKPTATAAESTTEESSTTESKTYSLFDAKNFSFDFIGEEDNKSVFKNLLDQLCWQMDINNLTSTQKYNILDGIDASQDVDIAKTEIQQELEKINLSA